MSLSAIDAAIGAHGQWKARLKTAIANGATAADAAKAHRSDACEFGKWLASAGLPPELHSSPRFKEAVRLHTAFHASAGRVLDAVAAGRQNDAVKSMAIGGEFALASATLTSHMMAWKREFSLVGAGR